MAQVLVFAKRYKVKLLSIFSTFYRATPLC